MKHKVINGKDVICEGKIYTPDKEGFVELPVKMTTKEVLPVEEKQQVKQAEAKEPVKKEGNK